MNRNSVSLRSCSTWWCQSSFVAPDIAENSTGKRFRQEKENLPRSNSKWSFSSLESFFSYHNGNYNEISSFFSLLLIEKFLDWSKTRLVTEMFLFLWYRLFDCDTSSSVSMFLEDGSSSSSSSLENNLNMTLISRDEKKVLLFTSITSERSSVAALKEEHFDEYCSCCFQLASRRCSKCDWIVYCND